MRAAALLAIHLLVLLAKSLKRGGIKSVIAENLLLKQQLIVMGRTRLKAPNLNESDRFIFGYFSLFISAHRRLMTAVIVKPSTLLRFHRALVDRKYSRLYSNKGKNRPGPKGPSHELINAVVEIKRRILEKHYKPGKRDAQGPSWLSLLGHSKDSLWRIDLFRCESLTLQSHSPRRCRWSHCVQNVQPSHLRHRSTQDIEL